MVEKGNMQLSPWLQSYISQILKIPKITAEREKFLFKKWRTSGDSAARWEILNSNLKYVVAIALGYKNYPVSLEDLICEGNFGLVVAFDKFNPCKGTRFITYASYWIRAFMLRFIVDYWQRGRTGAGPYRSKIFFKFFREKARSMCLFGDNDAVYEDIASKLDMEQGKVCKMIGILEMLDISLDAPIKHGDGGSIKDFFYDGSPSPEEELRDVEKERIMKRLVDEAMSKLDEREKFIIKRRIFNDSGLSLAEIGRLLGVSRERARQLESRAKRKIRSCLESKGITDFEMVS